MRVHTVLFMCFDYWKVCCTFDAHTVLAVVQGHHLLADVLDAVVQLVETVPPRIDIFDDPVVDVNEGVLCVLDGNQSAIKQLHTMHFVSANANIGLLELTWLLPNLGMDSGVFLIFSLHLYRYINLLM